MNKYQQFFNDKSLEFAEELYKRADKELLQLLKHQKINRDTLMTKIADIMLKYEIKDTVLNLSNNDFKKVYKEVKLTVAEVFKEEAEKEIKDLRELLITVGQDKFYSSSFLLSLGLDFKLQKISEQALEKIINKKINGLIYSDRIWTNKKKVAKLLQNEIKEFLQGNITVNDIEKVIKHRFNSNASNTKRLIRNETARVQTEVNEVWAKDYDIEWQMWMATLDDKTTKLCGSYDGKKWRRNDPKKKIPIEDSHINCRCSLVSLPSEDYKPKFRRDNQNKEKVSWQTYEEWKAGI